MGVMKSLAKKKPKGKNTNMTIYKGVPMPAKTAEFSKWANQLSYADFKLVTEFVSDEITREVDNRSKFEFDRMIQSLDRNISAAMILSTDFTYEEINNIFRLAYELIPEDTEKMKKFEIKGDGDWMKAVEKKAEVIRDRAVELVAEGLNQKKSIEILVNEFPAFSKSMITNCYKRVKEDIKKKTEELVKEASVDAAVNYILEDDKCDYIATDEELAKVEEIKAVKEEDHRTTGLVILNKKLIMDVAGEFGTYHIEDNVVTNEDIKFESEEEVENWAQSEIARIIRCKDEALKIYSIIGSNNG